MALFGLFKKKQCEVQEPFDMALSSLKKRNYLSAEKIINDYHNSHEFQNGVAAIEPHLKPETYNKFYRYNLDLPSYVTLSDAEVKSFVILYYLCGFRTETAVKDFKERTGIDIEFGVIHRAKRILESIDEIISGKNLSAAINNGSSGLTMFYKIQSVKDGCVCEHCKAMEGEKFLYKDAIIGVNYPPFNCCTGEYCRCMALNKME